MDLQERSRKIINVLMVKCFLWVSGYSYGFAETRCVREDNEPHQRIDTQNSPGRCRPEEPREVVQYWTEGQVQGEDVKVMHCYLGQ